MPERSFPDAPRWRVPGSLALPLVASRSDSVRYYARPPIDHYALSYHRLAVGLKDAKTTWVHTGNARYVGGYTGDETLALCDISGAVRWIDLRDGAVVYEERLSEAVVACAVQSEDAPKREASPDVPLDEQLYRALSLEDAEHVPLQLELIEDLAAIESATATGYLLALATHGSPQLRDRADELLRKRNRNLTPMLHALAHPPLWPMALPIDAMADALIANKVAAAAPLVAALLTEPGWEPAHLAAMARVLERLGSVAERRPMIHYLARFGCDPALVEASRLIARTLSRIGSGAVVRRFASRSCGDETIAAMLQAEAPDPGNEQ